MSYKLVLVDWAENTTTREYGMDIAEALKDAIWWSAWGNTDYLVLFQDDQPMMKFIDGEQKNER